MIVLIRRSHLIVRESLFCFDVQHDLVLSFPLFLFPPSSPETKEFPSYSEEGEGEGEGETRNVKSWCGRRRRWLLLLPFVGNSTVGW